MGRQFSFWVLLGFVTLFAVSFHDVQVNADVGPTESECRPYIEKALNELKTGEQSEGDDAAGSKETELSTEDTGGETPASAEDAPIEETTEQTDQVSGEEADAKGDSQEETGDQEQSTEVGEEKTSVEDQQESQEQTDDQKASTEGSQEQPEEVDEGEAGDTTDSKEHEEEEEASEGEHDQEGEKSTEEGEAGTVTEEEVEASEEVVEDQKVSGEEIEMEHGSVEEQDGTESSEKEEVASTEKQEEEAYTEQEEGASAEQEGVSAEQQEGASTEQEGASVEQQDEVSAEQQEEDASSEKQEDDASQEGAEQDVAVSAEDQEAADTQSEEKKEEESAQAAESAEEAAPGDETHEESVEDDTHAVNEEIEATTAEQETTQQSQEEVEQSAEVGESTKEEDDQESAEVKSRKRRSLDDDESGGSAKVSEKSAEEVDGDKEGSLQQEEVSEEGADKSAEAKVDQPEESEETKSETKDEADSKEEEKDETKEEESSEKEAESQPEDDLLLEIEIPENLRDRKQINELLHLDEEFEEKEKAIDNVAEVILRDLKRIYDNAIKPLEALYKYRDLSNRHYGDPEIFSKPLILFMGPWSGGKSSIINYLTDNEYTVNSLRTGADPSPAYFNILMYGNETEILDGTQLAADYTFSGLQKFGQGLQDRLHGLKLPSKLLEKVNIVEIPGILEVRKQVSRLFPFNDACQWFIDRADVIFLIYDPSKLDVGPETEAILDQLKGREYQTRIVLNKADQVKPEELLPVQSALIWNISPLMSSAQPPIMYTTSLWSHPYEPTSPVRLLQAQERAFLRDIRNAIDKRIENKIASARRFAVRVRNHAKMVDCYLTTYYNHKTLFGNKKRISDEIIDHPQNYHIYEGLSTLTNISRYDLPDPEVYRDFFRLNPLYEFKKLSETCTYFRGCPINKLDVAIAYDLPELVGKYKKMAEAALNSLESSSNDNEMEKNKS